jgi:hypothetical protein
MKISEHHRKMLGKFEKRFGIGLLREIIYRISRGDNFWGLKMYGLELYEIRYLDKVLRDAEVYLYEAEHRQELRLVYTSVA